MAQIRLLKLANGVWELVESSDDVTLNSIETLGDLSVGGKVLNQEQYLLLNNGYVTDAPRYGGVVIIDDPVSPGFGILDITASVAGVADATISLANGSGPSWSAGDFAVVSGTANNDGAYEIASVDSSGDPDVLTLRAGLTFPVVGFTQTSLTAEGAGGSIYQARVSILRSNSAGGWESSSGLNSSLTFISLGEHDLGGPEHTADTLSNLNAKVSDATLIDTADPRLSDARTPTAHDLGGAEHTSDTLANLNLKISDATLIDTTDPRLSDARTPTAHGSSHTDGTDDVPDFAGDSGAGGVKGLVPAPAAGDAASSKVLGAGGAWQASGLSHYTSDVAILPADSVANFFWAPFGSTLTAIKIYGHTKPVTAGTYTLTIFDEDNTHNLLVAATFDLTSLVAETLTALTLTATTADLSLTEGTRIKITVTSDNADLTAEGLYFQLLFRR